MRNIALILPHILAFFRDCFAARLVLSSRVIFFRFGILGPKNMLSRRLVHNMFRSLKGWSRAYMYVDKVRSPVFGWIIKKSTPALYQHPELTKTIAHVSEKTIYQSSLISYLANVSYLLFVGHSTPSASSRCHISRDHTISYLTANMCDKESTGYIW